MALPQLFGKWQQGEILRAHAHQLLAELLRRVGSALARALARRQFVFGGFLAGIRIFHGIQLWAMSHAVDASRIPELADIVAFALAEARAAGATQAEADASLRQGLGVTVRLGEVETIEYQRDRGLGITVYFDGAKGSASSADLKQQSVRDMVQKACTIARTPRAIRSRGSPMRPTWRARFPTLTSTIPGSSRPRRPSRWRAPARLRAVRWIARLTNSEGASVSHPSWRAGVRQFAWFPGWPAHQQPQHQLRAAR